jgi:hypothetical protein
LSCLRPPRKLVIGSAPAQSAPPAANAGCLRSPAAAQV